MFTMIFTIILYILIRLLYCLSRTKIFPGDPSCFRRERDTRAMWLNRWSVRRKIHRPAHYNFYLGSESSLQAPTTLSSAHFGSHCWIPRVLKSEWNQLVMVSILGIQVSYFSLVYIPYRGWCGIDAQYPSLNRALWSIFSSNKFQAIWIEFWTRALKQ